MQIKRHKSEAFCGFEIKPAFRALHLSKKERGVLIAAMKIADEARCKMEAFAHKDFNELDAEFARIEDSAGDIAEMEWMELRVDTEGNAA